MYIRIIIYSEYTVLRRHLKCYIMSIYNPYIISLCYVHTSILYNIDTRVYIYISIYVST